MKTLSLASQILIEDTRRHSISRRKDFGLSSMMKSRASSLPSAEERTLFFSAIPILGFEPLEPRAGLDPNGYGTALLPNMF